jgi:hypothetical protein
MVPATITARQSPSHEHGGRSRSRSVTFVTRAPPPRCAAGEPSIVALAAHGQSARVDVSMMLPFAAGTFTHLALGDLVPEPRGHGSFAPVGHLGGLRLCRCHDVARPRWNGLFRHTGSGHTAQEISVRALVSSTARQTHPKGPEGTV